MPAGTNILERVNAFLSARPAGYASPEFLPGAVVGLPGLAICWLEGPLNYGNAEYFMNRVLSFLRESTPSVRWLVVRCDLIDSLDNVAAHMLLELADRIRANKARFVLTHVSPETEQCLRACGAFEVLKRDEAFTSTDVKVAVNQLEKVAKDIQSAPRS